MDEMALTTTTGIGDGAWHVAFRVPKTPAIHHRPHQIEQDDVRTRAVLHLRQRVETIRRRSRIETFGPQHPQHHVAQFWFVFNDEDGTRPGAFLSAAGRAIHPFSVNASYPHRVGSAYRGAR
jgi:hypothetical protein